MLPYKNQFLVFSAIIFNLFQICYPIFRFLDALLSVCVVFFRLFFLVLFYLVIFYTLLLSISEYVLFDQAYLIASAATVLLISLYAKSHFASWKTAAVFFTTLGLLYGFIFILIRLEDTALLVGSIGLFIVLALVMYASRRINWYGKGSEV